MQFRGTGDLGYPADYEAPSGVVAHSQKWANRQFRAVTTGFTHVLAESALPMFGPLLGHNVVREYRALAAQGLSVACVSHGSDIRLPDVHANEEERWSPFRDGSVEWVRSLQETAERRQRILDEVGGAEFVSTPDLLRQRPSAHWLPVVVRPDVWRTSRPALDGRDLVVFHAPSRASLKGTELVRGPLERAADLGLFDLRLPERTSSAHMPALVGDADVVLDQFSLGIYGVAAVEAMAAGRIVVSHVSRFVRDTVRAMTGRELPIVEATPDTLIEVLADVRDRPDHYRAIAAQGPAFASEVHDGRRSAAALAPFLGVPAPDA